MARVLASIPCVIRICIAKLPQVTVKRIPAVPDTLALTDALERSAALSALRDRIRDSNARLVAIQDALPGALRPHVTAGPVDDDGWTLLVPNVSIATKLRQLQPRLEERLRHQGWLVSGVRIKVRPTT